MHICVLHSINKKQIHAYNGHKYWQYTSEYQAGGAYVSELKICIEN